MKHIKSIISILKATAKDYAAIVSIGKVSVKGAHLNSCAEETLNTFLDKNYNDKEIKKELKDRKNIYYIIYYNGRPVGFSKIVLNDEHVSISGKNVTKLDRIYLLKEFYNLKLGIELLKFNIELCKKNNQSGIWLYTWVGNKRAVDFYLRAGFKIAGSHSFKVSEMCYNSCHLMFLALDEESKG